MKRSSHSTRRRSARPCGSLPTRSGRLDRSAWPKLSQSFSNRNLIRTIQDGCARLSYERSVSSSRLGNRLNADLPRHSGMRDEQMKRTCWKEDRRQREHRSRTAQLARRQDLTPRDLMGHDSKRGKRPRARQGLASPYRKGRPRDQWRDSAEKPWRTRPLRRTSVRQGGRRPNPNPNLRLSQPRRSISSLTHHYLLQLQSRQLRQQHRSRLRGRVHRLALRNLVQRRQRGRRLLHQQRLLRLRSLGDKQVVLHSSRATMVPRTHTIPTRCRAYRKTIQFSLSSTAIAH